MSIDHASASSWLNSLKTAWEAGDGARALRLFGKTTRYYERPFRPGTTPEEISGYWRDIDGLIDITFDYEISAIADSLVVAHWQNGFTTPDDGKRWLLDGVFFITFDEAGDCVEFRQWWFAKD